jgi:hypothetical protein
LVISSRCACCMLEPRRCRNRDHVGFVAAQPCLVCGRQPSDPHHIRFAQKRALGRKVSDEFTVPLCRIHHRELHRKGDEAAWWISVKIDPMPIALRLWQHSRGVNPEADPRRATTVQEQTETGNVSKPSVPPLFDESADGGGTE